MNDSPTTCVVELTPKGRGAVAVVLVDGPLAVLAVENCFAAASGRLLAAVPLNRIVVGRWGGPAGEELVVCRRAEEQVEVHCHGGAAAVRSVVEALVNNGCHEVAWREWLLSCQITPKLGSSPTAADATSRAALFALPDATTARTAAILVDQLNGSLSRAIGEAIAAIDEADWPRAAACVSKLLSHRELGLHLTTPWRVVLAGPPNVGKSSLINALAGYERAIVSPVPGTTRDVVTLTTAIEGWPVELADTAGLRESADELENASVQLAINTLANADLILLVHDATAYLDCLPEPAVDTNLMVSALGPSSSRQIMHVCNKMDLVPANSRPARFQDDAPHQVIYTSAMTGMGVAELAAAIGGSLVPTPPAAGAAVPFDCPADRIACRRPPCDRATARNTGPRGPAINAG